MAGTVRPDASEPPMAEILGSGTPEDDKKEGWRSQPEAAAEDSGAGGAARNCSS